ncbi:MFS transporter [Mangrovicoccus algicola]|uniref:MFS transporter n=1 Tax=Mangrovicoccus algicola TaxID=2771008 RepID=A0A8J6YU15_9RHOB|nr:MFS transporter [Mangrovicoccus algicola]MBE3639258.1 MFS transporter [Mangrovicoccus algicola]
MSHAPAAGGARPVVRSARYQFVMVALLSLTFGVVFFDRNALGFLMPFIQPELGLTNAQIGMLASALSFTWALSAFAIGKLSDTIGRRKMLLIASTIAFSLCSFLSGLASSFALLLGARLLMGAAEGGFMPIAHTMVAAEVAPERRGLAQGITQNFGSNLLGSFVAPVLLVGFATAFGWREAFYLAGVPGLLCAVMMWFMIEEPAAPQRHVRGPKGSLRDVLRDRNVVICVTLSVLLVGYLVICWAFMPLYLTQVKGVPPEAMGWLMGSLGISATLGSFVVSGLSDRYGRRPIMILMPALGLLLPLGALFFDGSLWLLAVFFFIGWGVNGIFPLFMATVPSESVDPRHVATALGLSMGMGEVLGGVLAPSLAGVAADAAGLTAPLWIMAALTVLSFGAALFLRETAPSQVGRPLAGPAPAE